MKNIRLFITAFVFSLIFVQVHVKITNAADFAVCSGTSGCRKCAPNTSDPDVCGLEDQGISPGVACAAGANPPNANICSDIVGDPGKCNATYIACIAPTVPQGGFFCDTSGTFPTCAICDNDIATATPDCPKAPNGSPLPAPFSTEAACHPNCDIVTGNYTCVLSGGTCRTSCIGGEQTLAGGTCQTGICCRKLSDNATLNVAQELQGKCNEGYVSTAIGCIPITILTSLTSFFLAWLLGVGGGIAFLTFIVAGIQILTSSGDPAKLANAKSLFMSSISGIILLVFSIFMLRLIGVNVLGLF